MKRPPRNPRTASSRSPHRARHSVCGTPLPTCQMPPSCCAGTRARRFRATAAPVRRTAQGPSRRSSANHSRLARRERLPLGLIAVPVAQMHRLGGARLCRATTSRTRGCGRAAGTGAKARGPRQTRTARAASRGGASVRRRHGDPVSILANRTERHRATAVRKWSRTNSRGPPPRRCGPRPWRDTAPGRTA